MPDRRWTRGLAAKAALALAAVAAALGLAEAFARRAFFTAGDRAGGARRLWSRHNSAFAGPMEDRGCSFLEGVVPHPYLLYAHRLPPDRCAPEFVESRGTISRHPYPMERDPESFSILLLGGSVATLLAGGTWNGRVWLEDYLNAHFVSPNNKPFRVHGGAAGGWLLPIQNNAIALAGEAFDAFVAVDGFNEAMNVPAGYPIDMPPLYNFVVLTNPPGEPWGLSLIRGLLAYRRFCFRTGLAERSFLAYAVFERSIGLVERDPTLARFVRERVGRYFEFPPDWDGKRRDAWNRRRYETYVLMQAAQAGSVGARYAHFVQPIKELGKELTPQERGLPVLVSARDYEEVIVPAARSAAAKGVQSFLLLDVFRGVRETVYADHVHCRFTENGESPGYAMISERIGETLAKAWRLKRKGAK